MLLLLLAGTPVTAPPRLLNLAALLDFANVAYQAYQRAIERLAQATVEWQTLRQGNGQPEAIQAAAAAQAARHREVTDADRVYKAAAKKAKKAGAAPSADDAQREQRQRESNRDLMARARATQTADQQQQLRDQNAAQHAQNHLGFFGCINPELVGLTGCEEQRDRLKREKDMHLLWYLVLIITTQQQ